MAMLRGGRGQAYAFLHHHRRYIQALADSFTLAPSFPKPTPTKGTVHQLVSDGKVVDMRKWKKLDSRSLGIGHGAIPHGPWMVMKILRSHGFNAYLVGGCVRDLLLKKTPKDFDVITNANLEQVRKRFHRTILIGSRFPICLVYIEDSITEVSSFETVAKRAETQTKVDDKYNSQAPNGCRKDDFIRWKNSLKRDFTVNSLFFDPFLNKVYDYSSGISDLRSLKLRTIVPAKVSFEEDSARILRGLRIAARLGLSFCKGTESAIHKLSHSVMSLPKGRIFMELNYMLSYGAAFSSLSLLQRFNLLEIILPFHAAYLEQQADKNPIDTSMLMKLLSNLDKVVRCDHPSDSRLWVGLLAFHIALVNKPQDAFVAITLASILYHGEWKEGIRYARENTGVQVHFKPELSGSLISKSDEELAKAVSQLAASVQASVHVLDASECLQETMSRYPTSSCSGSVFVPNRVGRDVAEIFDLVLKHNPAMEKRRECFDIDQHSLGKGFMWETRFVLGKVILETMGCETLQSDKETIEEENIDTKMTDQTGNLKLSSLLKKRLIVNKLGWQEAVQNSDNNSKEIVDKYRKADETDELDKALASALENMFDLEVRYKEKEDKKPPTEIIHKLSNSDFVEGENEEVKKNWSEDNKPCTDEGQVSRDEEVMEQNIGDGKKPQLRITDTGEEITDRKLESVDREVIQEKKWSNKSKRKNKNERLSSGKSGESLVEEITGKKKRNIKNERKCMDVNPSLDDDFASLGEVVMEAENGDFEKKQRKSKDEGFESLDDEVIEKKIAKGKKKLCERKDQKPSLEKKGHLKNIDQISSTSDKDVVIIVEKKMEAKKKLCQRIDQKPSLETGCDLQDELVIEKKKGTSDQISSTTVKKKSCLSKDDKDVARETVDKDEGKQAVQNADTRRTFLLSSLFG